QNGVIQAISDQTNAQLQSKLADIQKQGDQQQMQERGLNLSAGLAGSPEASARVENINQNIQKAKDQATTDFNAQLEAKRQQILDNANTRADQMIQAQQQQRLGAIKDSQAYMDNLQKQAQSDVQELAKDPSVTLDRFKNSNAYQTFLQQTGLDPLSLDA